MAEHEAYRDWKVRPSTAIHVSGDEEFRVGFHRPIRRAYPSMTYEGYARALELYGNDGQIRSAERRKYFAEFDEDCPAVMEQYRARARQEGLNPVEGYIDRNTWTYHWAPPNAESWRDAPEFLIGRSAIQLTSNEPDPYNEYRRTKESARARNDEARNSENEVVAVGCCRSEATTGPAAHRAKEDGRVGADGLPLPPALSGMNGPVTPMPDDERATAVGASEIALITVDILERLVKEDAITKHSSGIQGVLRAIGGSAGIRKFVDTTRDAWFSTQSSDWAIGSCLRRIQPNTAANESNSTRLQHGGETTLSARKLTANDMIAGLLDDYAPVASTCRESPASGDPFAR